MTKHCQVSVNFEGAGITYSFDFDTVQEFTEKFCKPCQDPDSALGELVHDELGIKR
jgi:hypothetical protein